jgi:hypothetical protein
LLKICLLTAENAETAEFFSVLFSSASFAVSAVKKRPP